MKNLLLLVFLLINGLSYSQSEKETTTDSNKPFSWDNVRIGGGLGLNFTNNLTTISFTPTAVYDINDNLSLGGSLGYTYSKSQEYRSNVYTASILSIYKIFKIIEFSSELEQLFVTQKLNTLSSNYNYTALYVGLAYSNKNMAIGGKIDLLYNKNKSIYSSPFTPFVRFFF